MRVVCIPATPTYPVVYCTRLSAKQHNMADVLSAAASEPPAKKAKLAVAGLSAEATEFLRTEALHLAALEDRACCSAQTAMHWDGGQTFPSPLRTTMS